MGKYRKDNGKVIWKKVKLKGEIIMKEEVKEWMAMFFIFLILVFVINGIFNFENYRRRIKMGKIGKIFPSWNEKQALKWTYIWNIMLWFNLVLYLIFSLTLKDAGGIGLGFFIAIVYIFLVEAIIYPIVVYICKNKMTKKSKKDHKG